jgi:methyl-accepting chemotaxis protein
MDIRHWGAGLRAFFALTLALPLMAFGLVTWFSLSVIEDFVDVAKKSISELPAEKGIEVANMLAQVHDRSEFVMVAAPAAAMLGFVLIYGLSFTRLFSRLTRSCSTLLIAAQQLKSLGGQLSQGAEDLERGVDESGRAMDLSLGALEQLANSLQRTATEVAEADKAVRLSAQDSAKGEEELHAVAQALEELDAHNRKLEEVISAIDSIAFQTNILAVNAAVEAARAGEQGRGFGIVADAVKSLAQHSTASAKNIAEVIRQSGETSKKAMDAAQSSTESLSRVTNQARRSQEFITGISSAAREMSDSIGRLAQTFNQIDTSAESIGMASEMTSAFQNSFRAKTQTLFNSATELNRVLLATDREDEHDESDEPAETSYQPQQPKVVAPKKAEPRTTERPVSARTSAKANPMTAPQPVTHVDLLTRVRSKSAGVAGQDASGRTQKQAQRLRARDVIPFEGETEDETGTPMRYGTTSGF